MRTDFLGLFLTGCVAASSACSPAAAPTAAAPAAGGPEPSSAAASAQPTANAPVAPASSGSPPADSSPTTASTLAGGNAKEDAQWVQADDYFVATQAFKQGWLLVDIAKMKEPAKADGKGEALFFVIEDGREQRSAFFYRTRPAVEADLVLGSLLVCFDHNKKDNVYRGPRDKDNARPGRWWMAKVTDVSDRATGYVTLSGSYHCAPDALRAIVK